MMETWAVIGRILLDKTFHEDLFAVSYQKHFFEELRELRRILRTVNHLNLGRWEIMVIHRSLTEKNDNVGGPYYFHSTAEDQAVLDIRAGWSVPPPTFPDHRPLCAVVGLAAMDTKFREHLYDHTDPNPTVVGPLNDFLTNPSMESPTFGLPELDLINLNRFMRYVSPQGIGMVGLLHDYHIQRWVQPTDFPCDGGYSETIHVDGTAAYYIFFAQQALVRLVQQEPAETGRALLQKYGVRFPG